MIKLCIQTCSSLPELLLLLLSWTEVVTGTLLHRRGCLSMWDSLGNKRNMCTVGPAVLSLHLSPVEDLANS